MRPATLLLRAATLLAIILLSACVEAPRSGGSTAPAPADSVANGEWLTWGGDAGFMRYSPLDQITAANAKTLTITWRWPALPLGTRPDPNLKATPLYIDGVLYTPTGVHQAAAIDPATGQTLWVFTPDPPDVGGRGTSLSSRALAYWTDGSQQRLFHNTLDGRLISIDAKTGLADPAFGARGYIDLRQNLRPDGKPVSSLGSSSPPTVVGDVVIAQVVGEVTAANKEAAPGHIRAYDVRTGKLRWRFNTIPQAGEFGNDSWEDDAWVYTGNAGVWTMMSADLELGYVYLPVESATNDFYGGQRKGNGLFGESIVCLDAKTGRRVWHFQIVHHGVWDYDAPAAPILHELVKDGKRIKAVTLLTKQGMSFVFDRITGAPVWPIEERPVPQNGAPGEKLSLTQPFPTRPAPYLPLGFSEDTLIDFTPQLHAEALAIAKRYVRGPMYTPTTPAIKGGTLGTWVQPGYGGGANWNGGAVDPATNTLFVPIRNAAMVAALLTPDPSKTNWDWLRAPTSYIEGPQGLPILKPPYSFVTATDMNRGEHLWRKSIGGASEQIRKHPALQGLKLDFDTMGQPGVRPSPLVTKTLLFLAEAGNLGGDPGGPMFRAYDKQTGTVLAEIQLPERASGAPMTYLHRGTQYIVIAVGSQTHASELVALALPGVAVPTSKQYIATEPAAPLPAPLELSAAERTRGRVVYDRSCAACHGPTGAGIGNAPKLGALRDVAAIAAKISKGGVEMPPMAAMLSETEIEAVARLVAAGL